jgi:tetratricopeptide (TPR) repeat protein
MSLLMDALKRAERAREAKENDGERSGPHTPVGAAGHAESPEASGGSELSLEPVAFEDNDVDLELTSNYLAAGDEDTLSGLGATEDSRGFRLALEPDAIHEEDHPPIGRGMRDSLSKSPIFVGGRPGEAEDTSATLPSLKAVRASVDSYFDGTDSVSISMAAAVGEQTGVTDNFAASDNYQQRNESTTITGKRLGEEVQAQQAAQRVLAANPPTTPSSGRGSRILVYVLLPLIILLGGGFGIAYWVDSASAPSIVQRGGGAPPTLIDSMIALFSPPSIVQPPGIAPPPGAAPARPAPGSTVASGSLAVPASSVLASAASGGGAEPSNAELVARMRAAERARLESEERGRAVLAAGSALQAESGEQPFDPATPVPAAGNLSVRPPDPKIVEAPAPPIQPVATAAKPEPKLSDEQFDTEVRRRQAQLPQAPPVPGSIRITKARKVDPTQAILVRAYRAFTRGEFAAAERSYLSVLKSQPTNRDALIGAAAAAVNSNKVGQAAGLYQRALEINPRDTVAQAGLFALAPSGDKRSDESALKSLISTEPDAAHLHYSLGNLYASDERWPEAQAAYFEAVRFDSGNPDYSFNLAIALEHMRQGPAALDYYRRSLELARTREAGFDVRQASSRIAAMAGNL